MTRSPWLMMGAGGFFALTLLTIGALTPRLTRGESLAELGVDANPNVAEANTDTSLSTRESCVSVDTDDTFDVDIYIKLPQDVYLLGWEAEFKYDPDVVNVIWNSLQDSPQHVFQSANQGSNVVNLSTPVSLQNPDDDGSYWLSVFDWNAPDGSPDPGGAEGVLARLTLRAVGPGPSSADLSFTYGQVTDSEGVPIPYTVPLIPAGIVVDGACAFDYDDDGVADEEDNCPLVANPDQEDVDEDDIGDHCEDSDADGFTDHEEVYMGSDWDDDCPDIVGEDDAWPLDITMDRIAKGDDVLTFGGRLKAKVGDQNYSNRLDFNADGTVKGNDVLKYGGHLRETCT